MIEVKKQKFTYLRNFKLYILKILKKLLFIMRFFFTFGNIKLKSAITIVSTC